MKTKIIIYLLFTLTLIACKKEPGVGGKAHIQGHLYHNNAGVSGEDVFIWYGETNVSDYSTGYDNQTKSNSHGEFEFHDMNKGDYFLYGKFADSIGNIYTGTLHVKIKSKSESVNADIVLK